MKLNDEEQAMLAGEAGIVAKTAIEHQIKVGRFFHATDFVPVTQAHIMADTESLGQAGVMWLERLADANEGGVRIPTITDPRGTDFTKASMLGQAEWMLELERRAINAFTRLGVSMTDTCINYQTVLQATRGEHVAFGDTGVVVYSNSVGALGPTSKVAHRRSPLASRVGLRGTGTTWTNIAKRRFESKPTGRQRPWMTGVRSVASLGSWPETTGRFRWWKGWTALPLLTS